MKTKSFFSIIGLPVAFIVIFFAFKYISNPYEFDKSSRELVHRMTCKKKMPKENDIASLKVDHNKEIVFGQSAFFSGSFQLYGELICNSIRACFNRVNDEGGIKGKILRLVSVDDKGEPILTEKNITQMLDKHNIDMYLGNMGTRSVFKVLPLISSGKIAMFFPWGGDEILRTPDYKYIINGLGYIQPQIKALVKHVVEERKYKKIAIFHDDGSFGLANAKDIINELAQYGVTPVIDSSYNRFTMDIATPARKVIAADPKVVICLATTMPTVKLINKMFEEGHYGTQFLGIDSTMFVGEILKNKGIDYYYASPVPDPKNSMKSIVKKYREDIKTYFPKDPYNILSLAYYIHATIIVEAIKNIEGDITKENIISEIEKMKNFDIGGFIVSFNKNNRHAYEHVISIVKG